MSLSFEGRALFLRGFHVEQDDWILGLPIDFYEQKDRLSMLIKPVRVLFLRSIDVIFGFVGCCGTPCGH